MRDNALGSLLLTLLVLVFVVVRQLRPRAVREDRPYLLMTVLGAIGVVEIASFTKDNAVNVVGWALFGLSLVVGIGFGLARGAQVHVWRRDGVLTRQGNLVTVVLWVVGLGVHLGVDAVLDIADPGAKGLGLVGLWLYLGLALAAQRYVTLERAEHLVAAPAT